VYYGNAGLVIEPNAYAEQAAAASLEQPPLFLWIGFHPVNEPAGLSAYTTGLRTFGHLELEAHDTSLSPPELLGRLADVAQYQLLSRIQIADNDTFGSTAEERIRISHRASRFMADTITCQLAL
jgi:Domain of unknown function (DUF4261)